jgi:hypothetical protein
MSGPSLLVSAHRLPATVVHCHPGGDREGPSVLRYVISRMSTHAGRASQTVAEMTGGAWSNCGPGRTRGSGWSS